MLLVLFTYTRQIPVQLVYIKSNQFKAHSLVRTGETGNLLNLIHQRAESHCITFSPPERILRGHFIMFFINDWGIQEGTSAAFFNMGAPGGSNNPPHRILEQHHISLPHPQRAVCLFEVLCVPVSLNKSAFLWKKQEVNKWSEAPAILCVCGWQNTKKQTENSRWPLTPHWLDLPTRTRAASASPARLN